MFFLQDELKRIVDEEHEKIDKKKEDEEWTLSTSVSCVCSENLF